MRGELVRWLGPAAAVAGLACAVPGTSFAQAPGARGSSQIYPGHLPPVWSGGAYPGGPPTPVPVPAPDASLMGPAGQIPGSLPTDTGAPPPAGQYPGAQRPELPSDIGAPPAAGAAPGTEGAPSTTPPESAFPSTAPAAPAPSPFAPGAGAFGTPGLDAAMAGPVTGLGGGLGTEGAGSLTMLGDSPTALIRFNPLSVRPQASGVPPIPPPVRPPIPGEPQFGEVLPDRYRSKPMYAGIRGIKICENQSPLPQDRIYFSFNYFNDVNGEVNSALGSPITNINVYRYILGFEKTFAEGRGSIGMRLPLDNLGSNALFPGLATDGTAIGDLNAILKYAIAWDREAGNIFTGGLLLGIPTGPDQFAGFRNIQGLNNFRIQPFVGYIYNIGRFYFQGFSAISVPTDTNDVTVWYNDNGIGYFVYKANDPDQLITTIAPTFEVHVNTPLNHSNAFDILDPAGMPNYVNFTYGVNVGIKRRGLLSVGYVHPVTNPQPFEGELVALLNYRF